MARMAAPKAGPPAAPHEDFGKKVKAHTRYYTSDGKRVPGVTTVIGLLNKPYLVKWANNLGLQGIDSEKYTDEAASIGALAHDIIMCELRGQTPETADFTANQIQRAGHALAAFHDWKKDYQLQPLLTEEKLISDRYRYGGTIDNLSLLNGVLTLIDYKTSKAIYDEHKIQVAGYWKLLDEHGHKIKGARILRIPRVGEENFAEERLTGQRLVRDWNIFRHLLSIYRIQKGDDAGGRHRQLEAVAQLVGEREWNCEGASAANEADCGHCLPCRLRSVLQTLDEVWV